LAELNRKNAGTAKPELIARIGLESGPAVLDDNSEIYGDVANIAARARRWPSLVRSGHGAGAAPGRRAVCGGRLRHANAQRGARADCAVRASGGGRRSGQRNLTPLVGRDEEIALLMRRWERARRGEGQLTLIVGEPGLGKSRLIEEFHMRLKETLHTWSEWACSQLLQNTPLHPVAEWGRQRFGGADMPAERRLADLDLDFPRLTHFEAAQEPGTSAGTSTPEKTTPAQAPGRGARSGLGSVAHLEPGDRRVINVVGERDLGSVSPAATRFMASRA